MLMKCSNVANRQAEGFDGPRLCARGCCSDEIGIDTKLARFEIYPIEFFGVANERFIAARADILHDLGNSRHEFRVHLNRTRTYAIEQRVGFARFVPDNLHSLYNFTYNSHANKTEINPVGMKCSQQVQAF